jgi:hypothetical protein
MVHYLDVQLNTLMKPFLLIIRHLTNVSLAWFDPIRRQDCTITPLNGSPRQNGLLRVFWRGPPPARDNIYLSRGCFNPVTPHNPFHHGGRPCYLGRNPITEASSTTRALQP